MIKKQVDRKIVYQVYQILFDNKCKWNRYLRLYFFYFVDNNIKLGVVDYWKYFKRSQ